MKITSENWKKIWNEFHIIVAYNRDYINDSYDVWKGARGQNVIFRNLIKEVAAVRFTDNDWKKYNIAYSKWFNICIFSPTSEQQMEWMMGTINYLVEKQYEY